MQPALVHCGAFKPSWWQKMPGEKWKLRSEDNTKFIKQIRRMLRFQVDKAYKDDVKTPWSDAAAKLKCTKNLRRQLRKLHFLDFQGIVITDTWDPESCEWKERHFQMTIDQVLKNAQLKGEDDIWLVHEGPSPKPSSSAGPCHCLLYTSPSPRDGLLSRMPSSA